MSVVRGKAARQLMARVRLPQRPGSTSDVPDRGRVNDVPRRKTGALRAVAAGGAGTGGSPRSGDPSSSAAVVTGQGQAPLSYRDEEQKSLDLVQRWVVAALITVVGGSPTAALAVYSARLGLGNLPAGVLGLCVMSAILGLLTALAIALVHRRRGWSLLLVMLGIAPAAVSAYYLFR